MGQPQRNTELPLIRKGDLQELFLIALANRDGNIKSACEITGVDRKTFNTWMQEDPKFVESVEVVAEEILDNAEQVLQDAINSGNLTATIFFLKCKGKKRGYIEREMVTPPSGPMVFEMNFGKLPEPQKLIDVTPAQLPTSNR